MALAEETMEAGATVDVEGEVGAAGDVVEVDQVEDDDSLDEKFPAPTRHEKDSRRSAHGHSSHKLRMWT